MISSEEKKFISQYSKEVKRAIRLLVEENDFLENFIDLNDFCGACGIASLAMHKKLRSEGIDCSWVYGYHQLQEPEFGERHCWLEYKSKVVDVTYKQISSNSKNIYISPVRYVKLKENPTHHTFNKYWKWQNPYKFEYYWNKEELEILPKNIK